MKPIDFPEANFTFTRPSDMTDEECGSPSLGEVMALMELRDEAASRVRALAAGDGT